MIWKYGIIFGIQIFPTKLWDEDKHFGTKLVLELSFISEIMKNKICFLVDDNKRKKIHIFHDFKTFKTQKQLKISHRTVSKIQFGLIKEIVILKNFFSFWYNINLKTFSEIWKYLRIQDSIWLDKTNCNFVNFFQFLIKY